MSTIIKDKNSTNKIMMRLLVALTPIILFSFYKNGIIPYYHNKISFINMFYPLIFIFIPTLITFSLELLFGLLIKKKRGKELTKYVKESYAIFPGLFLGLVCPITLPISILIVGAIASSILGKLVYGGFGQNIFNPALIGYVVIVFSYSLFFSSNAYLNKYELDTIGGATPLTTLKSVDTVSYDTIVKPYGSLNDFFLGFIPGSVGEVSSILCIVAFVYLALTKTIKWQIPVFYVGTVFVLTLIIGLLSGQGIYYPLFHLLSGGLLFGAVFMATDPVTSPVTKPGMILAGLIMGVLTVHLRFNSSFPEGVATSILTMNMLTFILDRLGIGIKLNIKKIIIPLIIIIGICIMVIINISSKFNKTVEGDPKFKLISKETSGSKVIYTVSEKGYSSNIKAIIEMENGLITKFDVIEQNDSFYAMIEDNNYINTLISSANNLDNVDTISGATFTSTALKKMLINVINDYEKDGFKLMDNNINVVPAKQNNFEIIENDDNSYLVLQKGFSGKMKVKVNIIDNQISNLEFIEINDTYQDKVFASDYIDRLILNQNDVTNVDTVSGATITSKAIKNIFVEMEKVLNER